MKSQLSFWLVLKRFLLIFLPLLMLVTSLSLLFYYIEAEHAKRERHIFETNEVEHVNQQMKAIINGFNFIKSDLIVLTGHTEMHNFLQTGEVHHKKALAEEFLQFSVAKGIYDQARFLDENGMEVLRVNFNKGNSYIVPNDQLQLKRDRYYFKETFKLDKGEMFVSPFALNIEEAKIEKPLKPIIRFGTTVFDIYGQKRGIVVLSYLGENLINKIKFASKKVPGKIMLLNSNGYWLHGVKPEDEWGFMYEDRKNLVFGNTFPEAWKQISTDSSGHFYNADGLFTYTTVYPLLEGWNSRDSARGVFEKSPKGLKADEYAWKIVSYVEPVILSARLGSITIIIISIYGAVIVLIGFGSWFLASSSTRRKIAEERITSFANILEETLNEIYIFDARTFRFIQVNKGARLNLGYSIEELNSLTPLDLKPEFTTESFTKMVEPLRIGEKKNMQFTTVHRRKDGSLYDVEVHLQLLTFQSTPAFVAIILDITDRKKMEKKLLESEARFRTVVDDVLDNSMVGIFILDDEFKIVWVNKTLEKYFGLNGEKIIGQDKRQTIRDKIESIFEDPKGFVEKVFATYDNNTYIEAFECHVMPAGERKERWLLHQSMPISTGLYKGGRVEFYHDVTERKRMEEVLMQSEKLKSIGTIAAGVAHEFNNVLAIISGNVQLLEETSKDNKELTDALRTIIRATDDGTEISSKMLQFTKTETGTARLVSFDIKDLVNDSIEFTQPRWKNEAQAKGINYKISTEGMITESPILCNPTELREVFINIINNALDAMPEGGSLSFSSWSGDDSVFVSISDTGAGMSEDVKKRIFDPFYTTKMPVGTGLGMSMAYGLITRHGGSIKVESEIGKGSTFTLQFPVTMQAINQTTVPKPKQEKKKKNLHILVVDDEEAIRNILDKYLSRSGHMIHAVDNGADAIKLVKKEVFDLVLCDLAMPHVFGYDVIKALNLLEKRPKIGIITGWGENLRSIKEVGEEIDFIVRKPFNFSELTKKINEEFGNDN